MAPQEQDLEKALAGDEAALSQLVDALSPVVQARVARAWLRWGLSARGRNIRQEVEDLTQEVFLALFARNGAVLRSWDRTRGLPLADFVGLVAYRHTIAVLRNRKHRPLTELPAQVDDFEAFEARIPTLAAQSGLYVVETEQQLASRELLGLLYRKLDRSLSPLGRQMFDLLFVDQLSATEVCAATGMSHDAVYAWRSRLAKRARTLMTQILADETPRSEPASVG